jgi:hypothetical protein
MDGSWSPGSTGMGEGPECGENGLGLSSCAPVEMDLQGGNGGWIPMPGISASGNARVRWVLDRG